MAFRQLTLGQGVARLTVIETLVSPLRPAAATLLQPASISSIYSLGAALMIAFAWLALRRKRRGRPVVVKALVRAIFSRRVLLHRSTFADLAYCVIGLATLGAIIGWAVVSTSWISDGVAASLTRCLGPHPEPHAPDFVLNGARTLALFSPTTSASSSTTPSSTAFRRYGNCTRPTIRLKC